MAGFRCILRALRAGVCSGEAIKHTVVSKKTLRVVPRHWEYNRDTGRHSKRQLVLSHKEAHGTAGDSGRVFLFYLNKWDDKKWGNRIFHSTKEVLILRSLNNRCDKSLLRKIFQLCNKNIFSQVEKKTFLKSGWFQTSKNESSEALTKPKGIFI